MAKTTVYPEWVQNYRTQGKTVKKGIPEHSGKVIAQPIYTYIGIITLEGVIESGKKKLSLTGIQMEVYGFSQALWQFYPES